MNISDFKPLDGVWALNELPIHMFQEGGTWTLGRLQNSPYYVSLTSMDSTIFYEYQAKIRQSIGLENEISCEGYLDLFSKIREEGHFNKSQNSILLTEKIGQVDGHHRLAILAVLHGLNAKVFIGNGRVFFPALDNLLTEYYEITQQRDELTQQRDELTQQRDALLNSTIWKATKPLRLLINYIKR